MEYRNCKDMPVGLACYQSYANCLLMRTGHKMQQAMCITSIRPAIVQWSTETLELHIGLLFCQLRRMLLACDRRLTR